MEYHQSTYAGSVSREAYNLGLRTFMLRVYNYMAAALAFTGLIAYGVSTSEAAIQMIFGTPMVWVVVFAPLVLAITIQVKFQSFSLTTVQSLFWVYAALTGISLSSIFLMYTGDSIARVFFITASMFGAASLYGYTTKRDLSPMAGFLFMGMIGILVASLVNLLLQSSQMSWIISIAAVGIFAGLTAYDNQALKQMHTEAWSHDHAEKMGVYGALMLYINFIAMFVHLLRLLGDRRS